MVQAGPPYSVVLQGASNVRDLGGYRTMDGRRVRRGLLFRSAALARLTEADLVSLDALGIRLVCDFRGVEERAQAPTLLTGPRSQPLPIEPSVGAGLRDIMHTKEVTGEALHDVLERAYVAYALTSTAQYAALLDRIVDGELPLLFHCSAGKDRTGFAAAVVLSALGVAWPDILTDFEATNRLWRRDTVAMAGVPDTMRETLLRADPRLLQAAFDAAVHQAGSLDAYLAGPLGLDAGRRQIMCDRLLEPA